MVAATYTGNAAATVADVTPRKSFWSRFMTALMEARMAQARREIRLHIGLLPYSLDDRGNRLVQKKSADMPFGGW